MATHGVGEKRVTARPPVAGSDEGKRTASRVERGENRHNDDGDEVVSENSAAV
jgi:hypothetical protein